MNKNVNPSEGRSDVPVLRYAVLLGIIIFIGLVASVIVGRNSENARPTANASPSPGVSMGPTPRY